MTAEWQVAVYGKELDPRTRSPRAEAGYALLETTPGFPQGLRGECRPDRVGLGDHSLWEKSVWDRDPAQFTLRPVRSSTASGQWYLQVAQAFIVPGHPTGETRKSLRIAFAVAPVADVDPCTLASLPHELAGMRTGLPTSAVRPAARAEPIHKWFDDDIRHMLAALVAGHVVNVVEPDGAAADQFARKALLCLACLPAAVRWRVPVGWQSNRIPEWCALGHGEMATSAVRPVRRFKGVWKTEELDLTAGWEVVRAVEERVGGAGSVEEVYRAAREFWGADLSNWNTTTLEHAADWRKAVGVLREAGNLTRLQDYLKTGFGGRPRVNDFVAMRPAVLAEVLEAVTRKPPTRSDSFSTVERHPDRDDDQPITAAISLEPVFQPAPRSYQPSARPLPPPPPVQADPVAIAFGDVCGDEWKPAWEDLATGHSNQAALAGTLGRLLGILPFDPRSIQPEDTRLIPFREQRNATDRLAAEWRQATRWEDWAELIAAAGRSNAPPVLRTWFDAAGPELAWRVIELELRDPPVRCTPESPNSPALRAAAALLSDSPPGSDSFSALEDALSTATAASADRLADRLFRRGLVAEALILEHAAGRVLPGTGSADRIAPDRLRLAPAQDRAEWARAVSVGVSRYAPRSALIRAALLLWDDTPPEHRRLEISDRLGPLEAEILLGGPNRPTARTDDDLAKRVRKVASALLPQLWQGSPDHRNRVIRALARAGGYADRSQLLPLLAGLDAGPGSPLRDIPAIQLAANLRAGLIETVAKLPKDLSAADALLTLDVLRLKNPWWGQRITSGPVDTTDRARAAAVAVGPHLRDHWDQLGFSKLLPALLRAALADETERQFWGRVLETGNVANQPGLRLLAGGRVARIAPKEEELLNLLDDSLFATALERFDVITAHVLGRLIHLLGVKGLEFDLGFLRRLGSAACQRKQALVADALIRHLVGRLDAFARDDCARAWDAAAGRWTRARSRATGRDRVSQLLLDQLFDWNTVHAETAAEWVHVLRSRTDEPPAAAVTFSIPPPDGAGPSHPRA